MTKKQGMIRMLEERMKKEKKDRGESEELTEEEKKSLDEAKKNVMQTTVYDAI